LKEERANRPDFTDAYRDWRVVIADASGKTTEVLNTYRQVTGVEWDAQSGLVASLLTSKRVPSPVLDRDIRYEWQGTATIDPKTGSVTITFADAPSGLDGSFSGISNNPSIVLHKDGAVSLTMRGPGSPYSSFIPNVQEPNGRSRYLDVPLGAYQSYGLLPDGKTVAFTGDYRTVNLVQGAPQRVFDAYFMPLNGTEALKVPLIGNLTGHIVDDRNSFDPNETRTAFLTVTDSGAGPESYLAFYDSRTEDVKLVAKVPITIHSSLQWRMPNQNPVIIEMDQDTQIDLVTGAVSPAPALPSYWEEPSPDGTLGLRAIEPDLQKTPNSGKDCTDQAYRVEIADRKNGSVRLFTECDSGFISRGQWISNEKFVLFVSQGRAGKGGPGSYIALLADAISGSTKQLLPERTTGGTVKASASGDRFVIIEERLLLFDGNGALLRDFGTAPQGYRYASAAFSPDGSQFAYMLAPAALSFY
jgi:hypothetical protein